MDLLKETSRSARLKYLLASVTDPSLCPQRLNHLTLTAGRDSKRSFHRQHFQRASFRWFKLSTKHLTFYSSAFLFSTISKSGGELIGQPDQHHRVVTQLPPSLDGGLDGQSLSILFFFSLLLPYKGHGAIIKLIGESFYARCPRTTYQTPFNVKLEQHHRMQFFASIFALATRKKRPASRVFFFLPAFGRYCAFGAARLRRAAPSAPPPLPTGSPLLTARRPTHDWIDVAPIHV